MPCRPGLPEVGHSVCRPTLFVGASLGELVVSPCACVDAGSDVPLTECCSEYCGGEVGAVAVDWLPRVGAVSTAAWDCTGGGAGVGRGLASRLVTT